MWDKHAGEARTHMFAASVYREEGEKPKQRGRTEHLARAHNILS